MSNKLRGELSVKINNATIPALVNMNAFRLLSERYKIPLAEIDEQLNDDPLNTVPKIVFCGMLNHCQRHGNPESSLPTFEQICAFVCEDETTFSQITNDVVATLAPDPASTGNGVAVPK
jgi:hypothetical protein